MVLQPMVRLLALALVLTGCTSNPLSVPHDTEEASQPPAASTQPSRTSHYRVPVSAPATAYCLQEINGSGSTGEGRRQVEFRFSAMALSAATGEPVGRLEVHFPATGESLAGDIDELNASPQGFTFKGRFDAPSTRGFTVALPLRSHSAPPDRFVMAVSEGEKVFAYGSLETIAGAIDYGLCGSEP